VTIKDVAVAAGVSYATVSRVLNDYQHVRPDKRQRVLEAMEHLGYTVNLQARSLAGGRSHVIGLLVHDLRNPYSAHVIEGIDEVLVDAEYELILHTTHRRRKKEAAYVSTLTKGLIDGLILLLPLESSEYLEQLHERRFPYVVITDHEHFDDYSPVVGTNNWQGAYQATRYLLELGHRRIGFLTGLPEFRSAQERLDAFQAAHADAGVHLDSAYIAPGNFNQKSGYESAGILLDLPAPPTAIFAANDPSAFGAYDAARERGLRIPDDLSLVGFDDVTQAAYMHPPLTTVRQPMLTMGRLAAQMLLQRIAAPERPAARMVIQSELVVRGSCAPPVGSLSMPTAQ
jgi:LacI family transcriptional regulator